MCVKCRSCKGSEHDSEHKQTKKMPLPLCSLPFMYGEPKKNVIDIKLHYRFILFYSIPISTLEEGLHMTEISPKRTASQRQTCINNIQMIPKW